jgi:SAM-dependent methyltransferase
MERNAYEEMQVLESSHWWFRARREILADQIARLSLPANSRILEVGAGTGGNLDLLRRFGRVDAVEPDDASRAYATHKTGIAVQPGMLPDGLPNYEYAFDLVTALDVVEHVGADAESIAMLGRMLKPGGFLLTTVPAWAWLWSAHDEYHHHKRRYTLAEYRALFEAAGLNVRRATYFNTILFPLIVAVRLAKNALGAAEADAQGLPGPLINGCLQRLFASERWALRFVNLPLGVSILVIAERPS